MTKKGLPGGVTAHSETTKKVYYPSILPYIDHQVLVSKDLFLLAKDGVCECWVEFDNVFAFIVVVSSTSWHSFHYVVKA
jgi:hypothetical protein